MHRDVDIDITHVNGRKVGMCHNIHHLSLMEMLQNVSFSAGKKNTQGDDIPTVIPVKMVFPSWQRLLNAVTNISASARMAAPPPCSPSAVITLLNFPVPAFVSEAKRTIRKNPTPQEGVVVFLKMLFPPVLVNFLLKTTAIFSSGVALLRGMMFTGMMDTPLSPVVHTLDGPVQGKIALSRNGSPYWEYLSIPYAEPPVGRLRFQPPVPVKPWKQVRLGLQYPSGCVQFEPFGLSAAWGVEDCLFLNVFVPKSNSKTPKPVLVYIYGGAYLEGQSSIYQPDYIMDNDIIVVTLDYRLGPLGFLNFQEKNDPTGIYPRGNMALKDQLLALRWVQRNIARFGGGEVITLMGDSAGAASVSYHMLSPLSRGLFHRAITISGSSLVPWGISRYPRKVAATYASRLGCHGTHNASSLLDCYMNTDVHDLVKLQYAWPDPLHAKDVFAPSLEIHNTSDAFLTTHPIDTFSSGGYVANVPLLTGITSGEGVLRSGRFRALPELIPILDENWNTAIDKVLFLDDPLSPPVAQELRKYYFGNKSFTQDVGDFFDRMTKLSSDALFVEPTLRAGVEHAKRGNPTYFFLYDYKPHLVAASFSATSLTRTSDNLVQRYAKLGIGIGLDWTVEFLWGTPGAHTFGVGHGEDILQIWNLGGTTKWATLVDKDFSSSLIRALVDFACDSQPLRYRGLPWPSINNSSYLEYSSGTLPYMRLDNSKTASVVRGESFVGRLQFWESLRAKYSL